MMQNKTIQFMAQRKVAAAFSILLLLGSIFSLIVNKLEFGLDFTGGTQLEIGFETPINLNVVRDTLREQGLKNSSVVYYGAETDVLIRMQGSLKDIAVNQLETRLQNKYGTQIPVELSKQGLSSIQYAERLLIGVGDDQQLVVEDIFPADKYGPVETEKTEGGLAVMLATSIDETISGELIKALRAATEGEVELRRTEFVGPQIGEELRDDGGLGMLFALVVVMVYVALRFQFKFSVGAVTALAHDVIIVLGFFSILRLDFDLTVLAAVLAVIGYSLNDTIVVSDRIRENFRKMRKGSAEEVINVSLTQTLERTLITSLTTLLVLIALFVFGGELIHGFATALIVGIVVGTYSSIYVAANVLMMMNISKEDLIVPEKEGAELDSLP
ncbi:MAG: protein translocase subunit SecF [Exilibacterium sp.]